MPIIFRRIDHKRFWDRERSDEEEWLRDGDVRADALVDLRTDRNTLSVYVLRSQEEINIHRVVAALAARRATVDKMDFALLNLESLHRLGLDLRQVLGDTPDALVNDWHRDVSYLTAEKVAEIATAIHLEGQFGRVQERKVGQLIRKSLENRHLDEALVTESVRVAIRTPRYQSS